MNSWLFLDCSMKSIAQVTKVIMEPARGRPASRERKATQATLVTRSISSLVPIRSHSQQPVPKLEISKPRSRPKQAATINPGVPTVIDIPPIGRSQERREPARPSRPIGEPIKPNPENYLEAISDALTDSICAVLACCRELCGQSTEGNPCKRHSKAKSIIREIAAMDYWKGFRQFDLKFALDKIISRDNQPSLRDLFSVEFEVIEHNEYCNHLVVNKTRCEILTVNHSKVSVSPEGMKWFGLYSFYCPEINKLRSDLSLQQYLQDSFPQKVPSHPFAKARTSISLQDAIAGCWGVHVTQNKRCINCSVSSTRVRQSFLRKVGVALILFLPDKFSLENTMYTRLDLSEYLKGAGTYALKSIISIGNNTPSCLLYEAGSCFKIIGGEKKPCELPKFAAVLIYEKEEIPQNKPQKFETSVPEPSRTPLSSPILSQMSKSKTIYAIPNIGRATFLSATLTALCSLQPFTDFFTSLRLPSPLSDIIARVCRSFPFDTVSERLIQPLFNEFPQFNGEEFMASNFLSFLLTTLCAENVGFGSLFSEKSQARRSIERTSCGESTCPQILTISGSSMIEKSEEPQITPRSRDPNPYRKDIPLNYSKQVDTFPDEKSLEPSTVGKNLWQQLSARNKPLIIFRINRQTNPFKQGNVAETMQCLAGNIEQYQLRAVIYHIESTLGSVFTVRAKINEKWYEFGDRVGQEVGGEIRAYNAHLVFYENSNRQPATNSFTMIEAAKNNHKTVESAANKLSSAIDKIKKERKYSAMQLIKSAKLAPAFLYGLSNLGNTCFLNASLNALFALKGFRAFFSQEKFKSTQQIAKFLNTFCSQYTSGSIETPLLRGFKSSIPGFDDGRQHCAHSFIGKLLMVLDAQLSEPPTAQPIDVIAERLRKYRQKKSEPLHELFSALQENLFICKECYNAFQNFTYSRTLSVPIPYSIASHSMTAFGPDDYWWKRGRDVGGHIVQIPYSIAPPSHVTVFGPGDYYSRESARKCNESRERYLSSFKNYIPNYQGPSRTISDINLDTCFQYLLRASLMSAEDTLECEKCNRETQHYKQSFLRYCSSSLVIHFQRFDERTGGKLDSIVDFPTDLNLGEYYQNAGNYKLRAVIYHKGSLSFGHYTARICVRDRWYYVNDESVKEVKGKIPIEEAYLLFYEREEMT